MHGAGGSSGGTSSRGHAAGSAEPVALGVADSRCNTRLMWDLEQIGFQERTFDTIGRARGGFWHALAVAEFPDRPRDVAADRVVLADELGSAGYYGLPLLAVRRDAAGSTGGCRGVRGEHVHDKPLAGEAGSGILDVLVQVPHLRFRNPQAVLLPLFGWWPVLLPCQADLQRGGQHRGDRRQTGVGGDGQ